EDASDGKGISKANQRLEGLSCCRSITAYKNSADVRAIAKLVCEAIYKLICRLVLACAILHSTVGGWSDRHKLPVKRLFKPQIRENKCYLPHSFRGMQLAFYLDVGARLSV